MNMAHKKESVPKSATNMGINLIAVVAYAITLGILRKNDISIVWSVVISVAVLAGVIALLERLTMGKKLDLSAGLQFSKRNRPSFRRISVKLLGFYVTLFLVVLFYMIFPHYHGRQGLKEVRR